MICLPGSSAAAAASLKKFFSFRMRGRETVLVAVAEKEEQRGDDSRPFQKGPVT